MAKRKRVGIFGWGLVAPKSPNIEVFERNLEQADSWLEPFEGFGPSNFLAGEPMFDFQDYRPWIDERFGPRKFPQLDSKMGMNVKYALGAFIQALQSNLGLEQLLQDLGTAAHVCVGTGLGDFPVQYEVSLQYAKAQKRWNRFWCQKKYNAKLADYNAGNRALKRKLREELQIPTDPATLDIADENYEDALDAWFSFWVYHSDGLSAYLENVKEIESENIDGDVDMSKGNIIRRKIMERKKLQRAYQCPDEPWSCVDPKLLWNIPNVPAAEISMVGKIMGPVIAPIGACAGFGTALKCADNAIQLGEAKVAVVGVTDPPPHPLSVGALYGARVISNDGQVSKPFTGLRGTHVAGGACIWIVGDAEYLTELGMRPLGLEILSVALSADADHIITPSEAGPKLAIVEALERASVDASEVATWDMHATATPGDWAELNNARDIFGEATRYTARKGTFGHGMSVCGGWELTAQHLGVAQNRLYPVNLTQEEIHPIIKELNCDLVDENTSAHFNGNVAGKISMGVGGINSCMICRKWEDLPDKS